MNKHRAKGTDFQPSDPPGEGVMINVQSASAIETELTLHMDALSQALQSLERAQQITQDSLQLEVCV